MVKIGMGGSYHTWSPTYPDQMGLLINTCNLKLDMQDTTDGFRRINLNLNGISVILGYIMTVLVYRQFLASTNLKSLQLHA